MELFKASRQWSNRPNDERFESLTSLYGAAKAYAESAREKHVPYADLRVEAIDGDVQLVGRKGNPAMLTHWSFGQLAARVGAPAGYLRELPATLAAQNLNHGLAAAAKEAGEGKEASLLFHLNGGLLLRALTSDRYERIWNYEVADRLLSLESCGWEPAVPDFNFMPDADKKTALYVSDHDMFAFLRRRNTAIAEPGSSEPIYRGIIVENSEVGAAALKLTRFLYRCMCGNHIIWGARKVIELSVRHVGDARRRWSQLAMQARIWAEESANEEEGMIARAKEIVIAATKEQVLDTLFGRRNLNLGRKTIESGYAAVVPEQDGEANTVWGMVQGLTRYSQTVPYAEVRTGIDRAAGKILEAEF